MPNSLRCKIKHLCHNGTLTERERDRILKALEQEPILNKIFSIIYPLSIISTPELQHKAIMQIAEMLEPLCLPESEDKE